MLRKALRDIVSPEIALAWRAFNFDVTYPNILGLPLGSRPGERIIWRVAEGSVGCWKVDLIRTTPVLLNGLSPQLLINSVLMMMQV